MDSVGCCNVGAAAALATVVDYCFWFCCSFLLFHFDGDFWGEGWLLSDFFGCGQWISLRVG